MIRIPRHGDLREAALQRLVLGWLAQLEESTSGRCRFRRANVVVARTRSGRRLRAGEPGQPDVRGVVDGRAWGIELKTRTGRQSELQRAFERSFVAAGGVYYVARTLAQAIVPVCKALGIAYEVVG